LARQPNVVREGRAALLTAGVPGAGKSRAVERLGVVDEGWRRLDADVVKDYLIEDLVAGDRHDDLLGEVLADGYPIMPAELATLVHEESVMFLDQLRIHCLSRGENVVIEGTLSWPPAGERLLGELVRRGYREVSIVDVEVAAGVAHEQALNRWWRGRQDRIAGHGLGGRFVPAEAIDRAFPDPVDRYSVCAANARALFDSATARALPVITLTVYYSTGPVPVSTTQQRHAGHLHSTRGTERASADSDAPPSAAQSLGGAAPDRDRDQNCSPSVWAPFPRHPSRPACSGGRDTAIGPGTERIIVPERFMMKLWKPGTGGCWDRAWPWMVPGGRSPLSSPVMVCTRWRRWSMRTAIGGAAAWAVPRCGRAVASAVQSIPPIADRI